MSQTEKVIWCTESDYVTKRYRQEMGLALPFPFDSIREAVLTVSPKRQYLGIACPTTPVYGTYVATITITKCTVTCFTHSIIAQE